MEKTRRPILAEIASPAVGELNKAHLCFKGGIWGGGGRLSFGSGPERSLHFLTATSPQWTVWASVMS